MTMFQTPSPVTPAVNTRPGRVSKNQLDRWKVACTVFLLCAATAVVARAQDVTVLVRFNYDNGSGPSPLVQGTDGNFYGATWTAANSLGTVFSVTPNGTLTTLHNNSDQVWDGLVLATDGNFYGTAEPNDFAGYIFKITPSGSFTPVDDFCSQPNCFGGAPFAGLIQATDGNFYGTTTGLGFSSPRGTIFKRNAGGEVTVLHTFSCSAPNCSDGADPWGKLVEGTDGNFYGTSFGGINNKQCIAYDSYLFQYSGCGTIFRITPSGRFTVLHRFCTETDCSDGFFPHVLMQAADGSFYGTTGGGGIYDPLCGPLGCGTLFKITPGGVFTTLHRFCAQAGCPDGYFGNYPLQRDALIQATDCNLYGATDAGGTSNAGTIFKFATAGKLTTLYSFCDQPNCPDGAYSGAALTQSTDGNFYGTAWGKNPGTPGARGTVFKLSTGLGPFVSFIRNSGKVGQTVQILGQGFTGATRVAFRGDPAPFSIKSDTYLTATVPARATTGYVAVTTLSGMLQSNQKFRVLPQITSFSPTSGPAGTSVVITGKSFTQATAVSLDCKHQMSFAVDSDTQITAIVPTGAPSGKIGVTTAGGRTESAASFTVTD